MCLDCNPVHTIFLNKLVNFLAQQRGWKLSFRVDISIQVSSNIAEGLLGVLMEVAYNNPGSWRWCRYQLLHWFLSKCMQRKIPYRVFHNQDAPPSGELQFQQRVRRVHSSLHPCTRPYRLSVRFAQRPQSRRLIRSTTC